MKSRICDNKKHISHSFNEIKLILPIQITYKNIYNPLPPEEEAAWSPAFLVAFHYFAIIT